VTGRIDQPCPPPPPHAARDQDRAPPLPPSETELRAGYPGNFVQLATYAALRRIAASCPTDRHSDSRSARPARDSSSSSGQRTQQTVVLTPADERSFDQLERVAEFLTLRQRARGTPASSSGSVAIADFVPGRSTPWPPFNGHRSPSSRPSFSKSPRLWQNGVLLERRSRIWRRAFERVLYLTGKATGQLQVVRTLQA